MKRLPIMFCVLTAVLYAVPASAQGFKWSFEEKGGAAPPAEAVPPAVPVEAPPVPPAEVVPPSTDQGPGTKDQGPGTKDQGRPGLAAEYDKLFKEHLELRKRLAAAQRNDEARKVREENARLQGEVQNLAGRIAELVDRIKGLEQEKKGSQGSLDRVMALETKLASAEQEKTALGGELEALQKKILELKTAPPPVQVAASPPPSGFSPKPGSDAYNKLKEDNATLKRKLVEVETARVKAVGAGVELEKARSALDQTKEQDKENQKKIKTLLARMSDLEQELSQTKTQADKRETMEQELDVLKRERQRWEQRLLKAERLATLLNRAQEEVRRADNVEKRDMHYNMAVVYAKEGRYHDAEREYLKALDIDPTDAGIHYNLGILYDDNLNNKRKAVIHYRRYLRLRPQAADAQDVKNWLLQLEMDIGG